MECEICCNKHEHEFVVCLTCKQEVCLECYVKLDSCPFCRSIYPVSFEERQKPEIDNYFIYRGIRVSIMFRPDQIPEHYFTQDIQFQTGILHRLIHRIRQLFVKS